MIDIVEGRHFVCWWVFAGAGFDYLATAWRDAEGPWVVQYRLRLVRDDRIGEASGDEKTWWRATLPRERSEKEVEGIVQAAVEIERTVRSLQQIAKGGAACSEICMTPIHSSKMEVVMKIVSNSKWSHVITTAPGGRA